MTTTLDSLEKVVLVKNKVLNRIKVVSSKFYSDAIDKPILVYINNEKTGCRVNKDEKNDIVNYYYYQKYGRLISKKMTKPFYTKKVISSDESTDIYNIQDILKDKEIINAVTKKYPFMFKDRFAIINTIHYLCNKIKIWNHKVIISDLPVYCIKSI